MPRRYYDLMPLYERIAARLRRAMRALLIRDDADTLDVTDYASRLPVRCR